MALFGNGATAEPLLWGIRPNIYHLSWVQLETPGSCAILRGVRLVPSHYFGEASSTPDGCRARRDEVLSYSAVLGIILQGLVMSILPGMKWHTPEPGYTTMYNEWRGRERNGLGSHLSPSTSTSAACLAPRVSRLRQDFECSPCFKRVFSYCSHAGETRFYENYSLTLHTIQCSIAIVLWPILRNIAFTLLENKTVMETQLQIHGVSKNFLPPSVIPQMRILWFKCHSTSHSLDPLIYSSGWQAHSSLRSGHSSSTRRFGSPVALNCLGLFSHPNCHSPWSHQRRGFALCPSSMKWEREKKLSVFPPSLFPLCSFSNLRVLLTPASCLSPPSFVLPRLA